MLGKPTVIVLAGPNGAGKTSTAPLLLKDLLGVLEYINADTIANGLSGFDPTNVALQAGSIMLERMHELARQKRSFAFETTLASRTLAPWLKGLIANGYEFHLLFLSLSGPGLAAKRVARRVRMGGHDVPVETIRRRFSAGINNFFSLYQPLANIWRVYDNSFTGSPILIGSGGNGSDTMILDAARWGRFKNKSDL